MRYRKKPVTIEAFQYDGDLKDSSGKYYVPDWAVKAFEDGTMYYDSPDCDSPPCELYIKTLEGVHHASVGDYIIQGVNGEIYLCKPDIFAKTYESCDFSEKQIENPKIEIKSDGEYAVLYLNGEHVRGESTYFHAEVNRDGDMPSVIIKFDGIIQKKDERGHAIIENDEIARQKFYYDNRASKGIRFEDVM